MYLVGWCPPSPERAYDPFMRRRVPSRYKRDPHLTDISFIEEDPAQSRQLMKKVAERTTSHWIARVRNLVREEGVEALFLINDIGRSIKHHRVAIERDPNLTNWCFGPVLGRHAKSRRSRTSSNSSSYVRIRIR